MPVNSIIYKGVTEALTEHKTSPKYEFGEKITQTRIFEGAMALCLSSAPVKFTIGSGGQAGYMVAKSTVEKLGNGFGRLTVTWEAMSFGGEGEPPEQPLPPDEYSADSFEINPPLDKKPTFSSLTEAQIATINICLEGATDDERDTAINAIDIGGSPLAIKLRNLRMRGVDSFYMSGIRYTWTEYSRLPPNLILGGFIQAPSGPLAPYFPAGLSWLRESDQVSLDGTIFRHTKTWMGAPNGHWDTDVYDPAP